MGRGGASSEGPDLGGTAGKRGHKGAYSDFKARQNAERADAAEKAAAKAKDDPGPWTRRIHGNGIPLPDEK